MNKNSLPVFSLTLSAIAGLSASCSSDINQQPPNIVFVYADDLGTFDLGCYGQKLIETPNIDQMARDGIMFTQFYSASPVSSPSRCSFMTGRHAGHSYIRHNANQMPHGQLSIPADEFTIAEMLKAKGYTTGCFGKWALGAPENDGDPLKQGVDKFYGYYCQCLAHNSYPDMIWNNKDSVRLMNEIVPVTVNFIDYPLSYSSKKVDYAPGLIFDEALKFIDANKSKPFFLYYATTIPHDNGEAAFDEQYEVPDPGIYKDKPWTPVEKGYAALITLLDKQVGEIVGKLKELGLERNTILIFTSDNGARNAAKIFNSSEAFRGRKSTLYEGGIREPFVATWPGKIKPGTKSSMPCAMYDLMPTFAEIAGIEKPESTDGRSFLAALMNKDQTPAGFLYWEYFGSDKNPVQAVRQGNWKLIRYYFDKPDKQEIELYNLENDLKEENNIAAANPEKVEELLSVLESEHTPYLLEGRIK